MWRLVALVVIVLVVGHRQRQRSQERAAAFRQTGEATLPTVFLRHPEKHPSAWVCGSVEIHPDDPPIWRANQDIANSRAILDPRTLRLVELRAGLSVSLRAAKPGYAELRLESDDGALELMLHAEDAQTLASRSAHRPAG